MSSHHMIKMEPSLVQVCWLLFFAKIRYFPEPLDLKEIVESLSYSE